MRLHIRAVKPSSSLSFLIVLLSCVNTVRADAKPGDPFAYNLRLALSPLAFQAAVSQSWFGSAVRVEYGPWRFLDIALDGRVAWLNATKNSALAHSYSVRGTLELHFAQSVDQQQLYGTVYPADTPAITGSSVGTDQDLPVSSSQRLQIGMGVPHDRDITLVAAMRNVHSLRIGAAYTNVLERARPVTAELAANRFVTVHAGYSYATHWNLTSDVTGKREVGYRRYYGDVLLTSAAWLDAPERSSLGDRISFQPLGARIGMQGAMEGLMQSAPAVGLAYDLELGAYPGRGGLEGYLFLALGVAIDVAAH